MLSDRPLTNEELQEALARALFALDIACEALSLYTNLPEAPLWRYNILGGAGQAHMLPKDARDQFVTDRVRLINSLLASSQYFARLIEQHAAGERPPAPDMDEILDLWMERLKEGTTDA